MYDVHIPDHWLDDDQLQRAKRAVFVQHNTLGAMAHRYRQEDNVEVATQLDADADAMMSVAAVFTQVQSQRKREAAESMEARDAAEAREASPDD